MYSPPCRLGPSSAFTRVPFAFISSASPSHCVPAGFDAVSVVAQEARSTKALPRATLASLTLSTLLYLAIATVAVGVLPYYVRNL